MPHSSVKMRAATQLPVIGPDEDLTGMLLQVKCSHFNFLDEVDFKLSFNYSLLFLILFLNKTFSVLLIQAIESMLCQADLFLFLLLSQIFSLKGDSHWHGPTASQLSLALQQALAKELMRAKQGQIQQGGLAFRLLQAIAALLTSAHAGPIVVSMHRSHALSCPLMRQLHLYQVYFSQNQSVYPHGFIKMCDF